jgi:excisionase family DNA binding protein
VRNSTPDVIDNPRAVQSPPDVDWKSSGITAGDALIKCIAIAVALELERMGLACQQRLLDVHAAARYLGMTANAIREKASAGQLPCARIDGKLRFDRREIDRWIDRAPRQGV